MKFDSEAKARLCRVEALLRSLALATLTEPAIIKGPSNGPLRNFLLKSVQIDRIPQVAPKLWVPIEAVTLRLDVTGMRASGGGGDRK